MWPGATGRTGESVGGSGSTHATSQGRQFLKAASIRPSGDTVLTLQQWGNGKEMVTQTF
jgi:hypothetical protein